MSGVWLLLQLVFGFAVVLAPGALVARTIGVRSASATLAWALALVFAALAVTFLVGGSLTLTLVLVLAGGAAALAVGIYRQRPGRLARIPRGSPSRCRRRHRRDPRPSALARRGSRRWRRVLPSRAHPEAARVRRPLALERERVPRRRAAPRLRVPALARLPGARREDVGRRPGRRRPPRADGARPAPRARGLRGGLGAVPAPRPGGRVRGSGRGDRRDGALARRRAHGARAPGDGVQAAARARRARAGARGVAEAVDCDPRDRGSRLARPCGGPPDVRGLPLDPVHRVPGGAVALGAPGRARRRAGARRARSSRPGSSSPGFCPSSPTPRRSHRTPRSGRVRSTSTPAS